MTVKTLLVPDIACEHCERSVKSALEPMAGVRSVAVDIPARQVTVEFDDQRLELPVIARALAEADYPVAEVR